MQLLFFPPLSSALLVSSLLFSCLSCFSWFPSPLSSALLVSSLLFSCLSCFSWFQKPGPRASFLLDTKACDARRGALEGRVQ